MDLEEVVITEIANLSNQCHLIRLLVLSWMVYPDSQSKPQPLFAENSPWDNQSDRDRYCISRLDQKCDEEFCRGGYEDGAYGRHPNEQSSMKLIECIMLIGMTIMIIMDSSMLLMAGSMYSHAGVQGYQKNQYCWDDFQDKCFIISKG